MLGDILYAMFVFTEDSKITPIACRIILVFAGIYLIGIANSFYLYKGGERKERLDSIFSKASTTLPTLGILGTFAGIFYGLINFDFSNKDFGNNENFGELLEGLKVAFGSSVLGLFFALIFRIVGTF